MMLRRTWMILAVLLMLGSLSSQAAITLSNGRFYDTTTGKNVAGRGVIYMQPQAMHHKFWDNLDMTRIDSDFDLIKSRGFDTIVLKPSWGDIIPEVWYFDTTSPYQVIDQTVVSNMRTLVDEAAERGMYVVIMNGQMTCPKLYTDAGQTLSTRIWTADYWVRYYYPTTYPPALYEDANTFALWCSFHYCVANYLSDKSNVLGYVIEPETTGTFRDMTSNEVYWWNYMVKQGDTDALVGYTPINVNSTTCNFAGMDLIFASNYPQSSSQCNSASNMSSHLSAIRSYNSTIPIYVRETGVSTYDYTVINQGNYTRALRNVMEEGSERFAGYSIWMSQDFDVTTFALDPNNPTAFEYQQAAFGLWNLNGTSKSSLYQWMDIATPNRSFETLGSSGRPAGWENAWPYNGTPTGWSVTRNTSGPYDGSYVMRMYTGSGAPDSIIFCCNTDLSLQTLPNTTYTIRAKMRYLLSSGGRVYLAVVESDENGNTTQWEENSWTGGTWTWTTNSLTFTTHPDTAYCYVRFGIGGQAQEYLDVDYQELISAP